MEFYLRIFVVTVTVAIALWILFDAKESNFQPYTRTRIKLWVSGFAAIFGIVWLLSGGGFTEAIWIKLLAGIIGGSQWAFRLPGMLKSDLDQNSSSTEGTSS
ncbi:MAG: hypothetical protein R3E79_55340 [Caldilineaceae bacterium]